MSINPSDAQRSAASLPSPSYANASSRHGSRREPPRSLASWSEGLPCGRAADAASGSAATCAFDDTSLSSAENQGQYPPRLMRWMDRDVDMESRVRWPASA